jgi:hypothetical protein
VGQEFAQQAQEDGVEDDELEVELTEEEFNYAIKMTDVSIR